jgi:hypothetical protein
LPDEAADIGCNLIMLVALDLNFVGWESSYAPFYPEIFAFGFGLAFSGILFSLCGYAVILLLSQYGSEYSKSAP